MRDPKHMALLYASLLTMARRGQPRPYSEIAPIVGLDMNDGSDRHEIGELLGYISKAEASEGRPMLSSLVIHKDDYLSIGSGFYKAAKETGRMKPGQSRDEFLIKEMNATIAEWHR